MTEIATNPVSEHAARSVREPLIQLRGVEKYFEAGFGRTYVLRKIDLDIAQGEFVTIMGPSGAGKSTLLYILGMLDSDYDGEYTFLGQRVDRMKPKHRSALHKEHVGFVFQAYHLIDDLTVYENLEVPLSYRNIKRGEREALVCDMLDRFQMVGKRDLFPSQLSGGQQQLVGIARALIIEPKVIFADEPTGNLHSSQGREIMAIFEQLNNEGTSIVQVTHSEENARYGERIVELRDGWIHSDEKVVDRLSSEGSGDTHG